MAQRIVTRTIHTIFIDLDDGILSNVEGSDQVEIVLNTRDGQSRKKSLTYGDVRDLQGERR